MKITVILPTNRPQGYRYAIYALSKQTFPREDWELVIVDDYHEDRVAQVLNVATSLGLYHVKVFKSKTNYWRSNRLISNARNTGLIHARGQLVVFLDDYCWVRPRWLEEHWKTYRRVPYTMVGAGKAVEYMEGVYDGFDGFPAPQVGEDRGGAFIRNLAYFKVSDTRGPTPIVDCSPGWFYTFNASAPLEKIIKVNGFDEEYDLTSEEDIDLGLRLSRAGCKFWYRPEPDCTVFHVDHRGVDREMRKLPRRYREVSYEELRLRGKLDTEPDEVQLVLKEKYGVKYDGSWGLHERNAKRDPVANVVDGVKVFDLAKMRRLRR